MVLQDWLIIVDDGQLWAGVDQVLVGEARVVHVVDAAGEDGAEDLQRGEHLLQRGAAQQDVGGLGHVRCVEVVVVGNILNIRSLLIASWYTRWTLSFSDFYYIRFHIQSTWTY